MPQDNLKIPKFKVSPEKIKEMTNVYEGNRISKVIKGLQMGKPDSQLLKILGDEFPSGTLGKIKKDLGIK